MLDKEKVLAYFNKEEQEQVIKVYNKLELAMKRDITVFTNLFVTPSVWAFFEKRFNTLNFKVESKGLFDECERRMLSFNNVYELDYPMSIIKINNKSKFKKLTHRDYLGSIMSLGVEREKISDIRVFENSAYLLVVEEIESYLRQNLIAIGTSPVEVIKVYDLDEMPIVRFEEEIITVSSLRVDAIIAKIAGVSRARAIEHIDSSKVLLDYNKVKSKNDEVVEGSRITIRGLGKFIIGNIVGVSKSGKQKLIVKKYI